MKKKIVSLCLVVALAATAVIGGTLAYFTDTDGATNTFTMGGVKIDLLEKAYNEKGELVDFTSGKLMPGVENKQDKIVSIKNTGDSDAYVWYEWFIPAALDSKDGSTGLNNILHVNSYGYTWDKYFENAKYTAPDGTDPVSSVEQTWDHDPEDELKKTVGPEGYFEQVTLDDGILYNKYVVLYHGVLAPNTETTPAMNGVYLDKDLDMDVDAEGNTTYTCFNKTVDYDFSKDINIVVNAYAIQAELADVDNDGDVDVYDAYQTYAAN
ncbi:MAG: hypothetical protein J6A62_07335 [Oscillospiraceae bacterium]|nr:hypothetical protein [Oscillospiraceae bacterium]